MHEDSSGYPYLPIKYNSLRVQNWTLPNMRCYSRQLLIRSLHFEELNFVLGKQKYKETTYFWWEWRELNTHSLCITNCEAIPKWISLWQIPSSIISTQWPTCTRGFILEWDSAVNIHSACLTHDGWRSLPSSLTPSLAQGAKKEAAEERRAKASKYLAKTAQDRLILWQIEIAISRLLRPGWEYKTTATEIRNKCMPQTLS